MLYNPGWQFEIAKVISINPLKFLLEKEGLEIDEDDFIINSELLPRKDNILIDGNTHTIEYVDTINIGDKYLVIINDDDAAGMSYVIAKVK